MSLPQTRLMLLGHAQTVANSQARMNRSTRGQWDFYANHRRHLERLLVPCDPPGAGGPAGRLCVLGAGNCNDLALNYLAGAYAEVHLVDIDPAALGRAVEKQGVGGLVAKESTPSPEPVERPHGVYLHAPVDLTGIADLVASWSGRTVAESVVRQAIAEVASDRTGAGAGPPRSAPSPAPAGAILIDSPRVRSAPASDGVSSAPPDPAAPPASSLILPPASFDVVLSPCVLSQILCAAREALGSEHPAWPALKDALRRQHLRTMARLLRPGGRGVLAIDLASSSAVKGLDRATDADLRSVFNHCLRDGKAFRGLEPDSLRKTLREDPLLAPAVGATKFSPPWLWHLGLHKAFIVYGLTFERAPEPLPHL